MCQQHQQPQPQLQPQPKMLPSPAALLCALCVCVALAARPCGAYAMRQQVHSDADGHGIIGDCPADRLVAYKVIVHTYWTRDLFPKHYPDWRPTAQWTHTVGRSHDAAYNLYTLGKPATQALKSFVETGRSDQLEQRQVGTDGSSVLDEFLLPAIATGAGRSESRVFVDSNHTLVSLATRMVPSPDWFVGVDSFQLCVGGSWMDSVTVELDPLDAGTDNGFTFTAPNWPTEPQGIVFRMTSRYPAHPAGSFYYPQNKRLPPIATVQFIKHQEFELSEVFQFAEDNRNYETVQTTAHLDAEHNHVDINNELSADIELERQHEMGAARPMRLTEKDRIRAKLLAKMNQSSNLTTFSIDDDTSASGSPPRLTTASLDPIAHAYIVPKNNKTAILDSIARRYGVSGGTASIGGGGSRRPHHHRKRVQRPGKDCRVGHWSDWSGCSRTCGIGEMQRHRKVIKNARRGGRPCPPLQESKWCGSARDCNAPPNRFQW